MEAVLTILKHVQREIGGGVVYLECEEKPELLNFYQNEKTDSGNSENVYQKKKM